MNKIRFDRLLVAGLVTFFVWIAVELLIEQVFGRVLLGNIANRQWAQTTNIARWGPPNHVLNIFIAVLNCTLLVWLYASLRPMYGVGTRTALITSAMGIILGLTMTLNAINLGLYPAHIGMLEWVYEAIEFPLAMIAGAWVYEGAGDVLAAP